VLDSRVAKTRGSNDVLEECHAAFSTLDQVDLQFGVVSG